VSVDATCAKSMMNSPDGQRSGLCSYSTLQMLADAIALRKGVARMPLGLLGTVSSYSQMLRKIAVFTFLIGAGLVAILRGKIPVIEQYLGRPCLNVSIPVLEFSIPLGTFLPALGIALLFRALKFHDRISDLLGIRSCFDVNHILLPLAKKVGMELRGTELEALSKQRRRLMSEVFYAFASSTPSDKGIDTHYVTMALDQWSWFWIVIEGIPLILASSVALFFGAGWTSGLVVLVICAALMLLLMPIWQQCKRYAMDEVCQIVSDPDRKKRIVEAFSALQDQEA